MGWQAASGLWDSNGAGNRYMDSLLSGGEPASLRAYGAQLREIAAEMRTLEAELHEVTRDMEQAWPEGTARTAWLRHAQQTRSALAGLYRAIDVGEHSMVGVTDRAANKLENTQTSSMTKSIIVNAVLGVLNSNPYTEGLVSPTGIGATIETIAELAQVANTINTFYTLYQNIAGDDETESVRQADAEQARNVPLATAYVPAVTPTNYPAGTTFQTAPNGMVYASTPEIPSTYQQVASWHSPAAGFPATGYPTGYPSGYPAGYLTEYPAGPSGTLNGTVNSPFGTANPGQSSWQSGWQPAGTGDAGLPPGGTPPSAGLPSAGTPSANLPSANLPSANLPSAGTPSAAVPGFQPVDPPAPQGGDRSEVTVTVRDGDASFEITTGQDGRFTQTLNGEEVVVSVDLASDDSSLTRTA